jgi:nucleotide-binding universal stress UspA family protein
MHLGRILIALKPWDRDLPLAANHARQLTQSTGAHVRFVRTVFDAAVASARERGADGALAAEERVVSAARVELERLTRTLRNRTGLISTAAVWGVPAYETIAAATREWRADLLVLGAHDAQSQHSRLTDTDWQLMRRVPCPLLLVKRATFSGYEQIVAALDSQRDPAPSDDAVLAAGQCFARAFASTLTVMDAANGGEVGRAAERRACLLVVRAPPNPTLGAADLEVAAASLVNAAPCDVLLVPSASGRQPAVQQLQVG